ncbi:hypothetical protein ACJEM1_22715, partial [Escherichia coli]
KRFCESDTNRSPSMLLTDLLHGNTQVDIQKTEIFVYAPGNGALITGIPFMATAFLALFFN